MINTERVMDLTEAFLHSYKLTLQETKNSQLAINVAYAVTHIVADNNPAVKEEQPANPFATLMAAVINGAQQQVRNQQEEMEADDDGEDEET